MITLNVAQNPYVTHVNLQAHSEVYQFVVRKFSASLYACKIMYYYRCVGMFVEDSTPVESSDLHALVTVFICV